MPRQKKQLKSVLLNQPEKPVALPPTPAEIAKRAHEIFEARGGAHGCDLDDWLQAERELKAEAGQAPIVHSAVTDPGSPRILISTRTDPRHKM